MRKEETNFKDSTIFEGMTSIRAILRARDSLINDRKIKTVLYDGEKMIGGEGEIALSTAEIEDIELLLLETRRDLSNIMKETVNLAELGALFVENTAVFVGHAEGNEIVIANTLAKEGLFFAVMGSGRYRVAGADFAADKQLALG